VYSALSIRLASIWVDYTMTEKTTKYDVAIIGAGAAGLMAVFQAGARGRKVLLVEHTDKIGEKIRISGGGRCNCKWQCNTAPQEGGVGC